MVSPSPQIRFLMGSQPNVHHKYFELARAKVIVFDPGHEPQGEKPVVKSDDHDNLWWCWRGTSPRLLSLISWTHHAKRHNIKALPHQDWKEYILFCLQAVNYLTSTHNEQCKTSQNLIKRQRQGPSADGKWLTQLIKLPGVRLNMASLSHHLQKGWDLLHISIVFFPHSPFCLWCIYYVDPYLFFFFHKGVYAHILMSTD